MRRGALRRKLSGAGRRTLLTPELQTEICAFVRAGTYNYVAAEACGISRRTLFEWLERGERPSKRSISKIYVQFAVAIRRAQAEARASAEVTIKKIDPKRWLSRMHREAPGAPGWNDTRSIELTGKDGGSVGIQTGEVGLTEEQRRARAVEIARLLKEVGALPCDEA